ncbi:MAG TPA: metallothionein [Thermoanaerobaculia bacterium]|jgi:predicted nucleic acid-binding Zn ribbon protein|nr:metallothionein [Thermoanaerobaculia bacterium]
MRCSHSGCHCNDANVERDGRNYCSERCAEAERQGRQGQEGGACPCGHADCAAV